MVIGFGWVLARDQFAYVAAAQSLRLVSPSGRTMYFHEYPDTPAPTDHSATGIFSPLWMPHCDRIDIHILPQKPRTMVGSARAVGCSCVIADHRLVLILPCIMLGNAYNE